MRVTRKQKEKNAKLRFEKSKAFRRQIREALGFDKIKIKPRYETKYEPCRLSEINLSNNE